MKSNPKNSESLCPVAMSFGARIIGKYLESDLFISWMGGIGKFNFANQRNSWRAVGEKTRQVYTRLLEAES